MDAMGYIKRPTGVLFISAPKHFGESNAGVVKSGITSVKSIEVSMVFT